MWKIQTNAKEWNISIFLKRCKSKHFWTVERLLNTKFLSLRIFINYKRLRKFSNHKSALISLFFSQYIRKFNMLWITSTQFVLNWKTLSFAKKNHIYETKTVENQSTSVTFFKHKFFFYSWNILLVDSFACVLSHLWLKTKFLKNIHKRET